MRWKEIRPLNRHVESYRLNIFIGLLVEQETVLLWWTTKISGNLSVTAGLTLTYLPLNTITIIYIDAFYDFIVSSSVTTFSS